MIHISEAINILNDKQPHDIVFVSKTKGTKTVMTNTVVLSSCYEKRKFNVKSLNSNQIRMVYYVLIIEVDNQEVYL